MRFVVCACVTLLAFVAVLYAQTKDELRIAHRKNRIEKGKSIPPEVFKRVRSEAWCMRDAVDLHVRDHYPKFKQKEFFFNAPHDNTASYPGSSQFGFTWSRGKTVVHLSAYAFLTKDDAEWEFDIITDRVMGITTKGLTLLPYPGYPGARFTYDSINGRPSTGVAYNYLKCGRLMINGSISNEGKSIQENEAFLIRFLSSMDHLLDVCGAPSVNGISR